MRFAWNVLLAGLTVAIPVSAQRPAVLSTGERLRVQLSTGGDPFEGTFEGIDHDELRLGGPLGERRLRVAEIVELRRADGTRARTLAGAVAGYAVGSILGAIGTSGSATGSRVGHAEMIGGAVGAVAGALLGHGKRSAHWSVVSPVVLRPLLLPGTRVRIGPPGGDRIEGRVTRTTADSVVIERPATGEIGFALVDSPVVEWPLYRKRPIVKGAGIGLAMGGVFGAALGSLAGSNCSGELFSVCFSSGAMALVGAIALGSIGLAAGAAIGAVSHQTVWETGSRGTSRLSIHPQLGAGAVGVAGTLRLRSR